MLLQKYILPTNYFKIISFLSFQNFSFILLLKIKKNGILIQLSRVKTT